MTDPRRLRAISLLAAVLLALLEPSALLAEVSAPGGHPGTGGLYVAERPTVAGGEDPGAWPLWRPIRNTRPAALMLNPHGAANGDGDAAFGIDPQTGYASVVWSRFDGFDYEVVISEWTGERWTPFAWLTNNSVDDFDPRIEVTATGRRIVTWWRAGDAAVVPARVWQIESAPGSDLWSAPALVTDPAESGRRSDVTLHGDATTYVSYQSGDGLAPWRVMLSWRSAGAPEFVERLHLADSNYHGELGVEPGSADVAVRVHSLAGRLWVDWLQDDLLMGYRVLLGDGQWSPAEYVDYRALVDRAGSFGAGVDMARQTVRRQVLR